MISPSTVPGFTWSAASLLSGTPSAGSTAANDGGGEGDSFQTILAQAVTPTTLLSESSPTLNFETIGAKPYRASDDNSQTAERGRSKGRGDKPATVSLHALSLTNVKSPKGAPPPHDGTVKQEFGNRPKQSTENYRSTGTTVSQPSGVNPDPANLSAAVRSSALEAASKKASSSVAAAQNALPAAAATALGGLKGLSGAAFAMHITPASSQASNPNPQVAGANGAGPDVAAANTIPDSILSGAASASTAHLQPLLQTSSGNTALASGQNSWAATPSTVAFNNESGPLEPEIATNTASEVEPEDSSAVAQPVRTVQVQLAGEGDARVDLRLVEHAGGLSVSVRASDSNLTRGLQENLPELSARLAADKYATHTLVPPASEPVGGHSSSGTSGQPSGQSQEQPGGGSSFSQGGSSSSGGQGDARQRDQTAAWWRQMAALGKLSSTTSASAQGLQPDPTANPVANSMANQ